MTREEFMQRMAQIYTECVAISNAKNADYASGDDPFKNFRAAEFYGVPIERAILIRMSDKMSRVSNLLSKEAAVNDESIVDTLRDQINYSAILIMWLEYKAAGGK
jgi:hypothetical protein